VRRYAADLTRMIGLVAGAGGVSVIAHPWGRGSRGVLDRETIAELATAGLAGIEAGHQDHSPRSRDELRGLADDLGLVATGSSDYHGTGKVGHDLGCHTTEPEQLARLLELAARSRETAQAAGARPPRLPSLPL
jgi:predicted metal-dependent phosphoesterase TrpH